MALRGQIVDFVGLDLLDNADQVGRIGQVTVVQNQPQVRLVRVLIEMIDTIGVEQRAAAFDAVHFIAFCHQEFRQIGAVLSGNAGNESCFFHRFKVSVT